MRKNGHYWVKYQNEWIICLYRDSIWFFHGTMAIIHEDRLFDEIDETPIERSIRPNLQNGLPLSTLKETLKDFPDSLIVTRVSIEMHNKYSIQITEFNIEANAKQEERNKEENV